MDLELGQVVIQGFIMWGQEGVLVAGVIVLCPIELI
jgi:hypothetical protein